MKIIYPHYILIIAVAVLFASGCGDDEVPTTTSRSAGPPTTPGAPPSQPQGMGTVPQAQEEKPAPLPKDAGELIVHKLTEESFIESPSRRDPFRSFLIPLTKQQSFSSAPQIVSILDQFQLDELKLVAIVSGSGPQAGSPMAMVEDPAGVGHIIRRGNYVGKGETVRRVSSGEEIQIFWKVARIREDAIVFEREDPFSATEATVTKILPLEAT